MYQAQPKFSVDNVFGAILVVGGIVWACVAMLAPVSDVDAARLAAQKGDPVRMVLAEPARSVSGGEVTAFPGRNMEVIIDKKYA